MSYCLIGRKAPDFTTAAVLGNGEIVDSYNFTERTQGKYAMLFFYPLDFTFVCPSELIALDKRFAEFQKRDCEVLSVSIDSQFTHNAYRKTPVNQGGIGEVQYTMIADVAHNICRSYGVEHPDAKVACRGVFFIDPKGIVRTAAINDLPIGRNVDECLRILDALQFTDEHGEVCPAGWEKGKAAIKPTSEGIATYLTGNADQL